MDETITLQDFSLFFIVELNNCRRPSGEFHVLWECVTLFLGIDGDTGLAICAGGAGTRTSEPVPSSRALVGLVSSATGIRLIVNENVSAELVGPAPGGTVSSSRVLGYGGADPSFSAQALVTDVILYDGEVSLADIAVLQDYAKSRGAVFPEDADRSVVVSGDSISSGVTNTLNRNWFRQSALPGTPLQWNNSQAAITLATLNSEKSTRDLPLYRAGIPNYIFITAGSNDPGEGTSASTMKSTVVSYGTATKGTGFKTIVVTPMPRTDLVGAGETVRLAYIADVRDDFDVGVTPAYADGIMDWASDPSHGGVATDPRLFKDVVHPTDFLASILAKYAPPFVADVGFTVTGPASGPLSVASGPFVLTIAEGGEFRGQMKVRISATTGSATYTVDTSNCTVANNGTAAVTVTPNAGETEVRYTLTPTAGGAVVTTFSNAQGWTNPAAMAFAAMATSAGGTAGPGASACTLHFADEDGAIADADVWLTTDAAGTNTVAGTLQTNVGGNVMFLLDAGEEYFVWMQKDGENAIQGSSYVAVAD